MNQGKLEVVKQEMARVNIDILGISKLKWTGMREFNSDDHYIYYGGQEPRREWQAALCNTGLMARPPLPLWGWEDTEAAVATPTPPRGFLQSFHKAIGSKGDMS